MEINEEEQTLNFAFQEVWEEGREGKGVKGGLQDDRRVGNGREGE